MSRISSTFGKHSGFGSSIKHSKGSPIATTSIGMPAFSSTLTKGCTSPDTYRKSTGNLAASFGRTSTMKSTNKAVTQQELDRIETEYIKNLQQQVYFLELEANFLREQARKATEMHPQMTAEAEKMLLKLRKMQCEVDNLNLELKRKDSHMEVSTSEKERIKSRLKVQEDSHQREKRLLVEEVVQVKKQKEALQRDSVRKDAQILQAREEADRSATGLREAETKIQMMRNELDQKLDQHKITQDALEEKRTELMRCETRLRDMEEKYYLCSATQQSKTGDVEGLRDEVRVLHQKLKEAEISVDQERYLRSKMSDDSTQLVKENILLNQQVTELQKTIQKEKTIRESQAVKRTKSISDVVAAQEKEKLLTYELNQTKDLLKMEQGRSSHYLEQLGKQEQMNTSQELNNSTVRSRLAEVENAKASMESENTDLRRDKMLLVDHVSDLQKQMEAKESELVSLRSQNEDVMSRVRDLSHLKELEATLQSQKWDEFSRLAESMKNLSQTMSKSGTLDFS